MYGGDPAQVAPFDVYCYSLFKRMLANGCAGVKLPPIVSQDRQLETLNHGTKEFESTKKKSRVKTAETRHALIFPSPMLIYEAKQLKNVLTIRSSAAPVFREDKI